MRSEGGRQWETRRAGTLACLAVLFLAFLALSAAVHSPALQGVDRAVTLWLQQGRTPLSDRVMAGVTTLGDTLVLTLVGALTAGLLWRQDRRGSLLAAATMLAVPLNVLIKAWVARPRPDGGVVDVVLPVVGLSFPSGHTMASTVVYGYLALLAWERAPGRSRYAAVVALAGLALAISASRIYLGAHWFSDVVGGWTAGLFFLLLLAELKSPFPSAAAPRVRGSALGVSERSSHGGTP